MSINDRRLLRHLLIAVLVKLVVLSALWWAFVRDERVPVDSERAAEHLLKAGPPPQGETQ